MVEKSYGSSVNQVVVESLTVAVPKSENIRSKVKAFDYNNVVDLWFLLYSKWWFLHLIGRRIIVNHTMY